MTPCIKFTQYDIPRILILTKLCTVYIGFAATINPFLLDFVILAKGRSEEPICSEWRICKNEVCILTNKNGVVVLNNQGKSNQTGSTWANYKEMADIIQRWVVYEERRKNSPTTAV